jgi:hypothetical protein
MTRPFQQFRKADQAKLIRLFLWLGVRRIGPVTFHRPHAVRRRYGSITHGNVYGTPFRHRAFLSG